MLDLIDRINWQTLQRLVIISMAFRQRALKTVEGSAGLPSEDEDGTPLDYQAIFEPSPAALWNCPWVWKYGSPPSITDSRVERDEGTIMRVAAETSTPPVDRAARPGEPAAGGAAPEGTLSKAADRIDGSPAYPIVKASASRIHAGRVRRPWRSCSPNPHAIFTEKYAAAAGPQRG